MNDIAPHPFEHAPDEQPDQPPATATFDTVPVAARADGWTPERQRQFIEELAECGVVREAAARVGMSEQSAYQLRRRPDAAGFNEAWEGAIHLGVHRLHSTAFERAISGTVKRRYYNGEVVGEETVFDNRLLIYLLGRLDKNRNPTARQSMTDWPGALAALDDGLVKPHEAPNSGWRAPVWRNARGWRTRFRPPQDFAGHQWGEYGEENYCRTLTAEEEHAVETAEARRAALAERQRANYFARLTGDGDTAEV